MFSVMPVLTTNKFLLFYFLLADLSYVGFVPLGDFVDMFGDN